MGKKPTPEMLAQMGKTAEEADRAVDDFKTRPQRSGNFDVAPARLNATADRTPGQYTTSFNTSAKGVTELIGELKDALKDGLDRSRTSDSNTNRLINDRMNQAEAEIGLPAQKLGL